MRRSKAPLAVGAVQVVSQVLQGTASRQAASASQLQPDEQGLPAHVACTQRERRFCWVPHSLHGQMPVCRKGAHKLNERVNNMQQASPVPSKEPHHDGSRPLFAQAL